MNPESSPSETPVVEAAALPSDLQEPPPAREADALPPSANGAETVLTRLQELGAKLDHLQTSFESKIRYDAGRESVIDRLHAELQEYKADLVLKILKPLALDLIGLYDDLGEAVAAHRGDLEAPGLAKKLLGLLGTFQADVADALYRHGFEAFTTDQAEFDPKRQRVKKPLPTRDAALNRTVAERLRKGFSYQDQVVRPEIVNVYVIEASPNS